MKNYKILLADMQKDLSTWRVIYYSWVERLSKLIKIFRQIIKIPTRALAEFDTPIPKIYRKENQAQDVTKNLLKKDKSWGQTGVGPCTITSQDLKNEVIVIKRM